MTSHGLNRWRRYSIVPVISLLSSCGTQSRMPVSPLAATVHGSIHGGQQPVSGTTIQLYAVGTTGDGSSATALLTQTVLSDGAGSFTITGDYTCPTPGSMIYLLATGGNPGIAAGTNNAGIAMMAAIGRCDSLQASSFLSVNELTTESAVAALVPFISSRTAIGSSNADATALASAFLLAAEYTNMATGTSPGLNVPTGMAVPVTQLNTIADILASCVNSAGGVAGDGSPCGNLFALTTPPGGTPPTDTVMAALNLANHPSLNPSGLFGLVAAAAPFQPTLSNTPSDFSVQVATGSSLSISPTSVTFPSTTVGNLAAQQQQVLLTNIGQTAVTISGSSLLGVNAGDFTVSNNCGDGNLTVGGSCAFAIGYQPAAAGTRTGALEIISSGQTTMIPLSASATSPSGISLPVPLADYRFMDGSGSTLTDSSGNGNNGTLLGGANAPTWTSTGLNFSGLAGYSQGVSLPSSLNGTRTFVFVTATQNLANNSTDNYQQYELLLTNSTGYSGLNLWDEDRFVGSSMFLASSPRISANSTDTTFVPDLTNGFHCKAFTLGTGSGGDIDHIYVDGVEPSSYISQKASAGAQTTGNFFLGSSNVSPWTTAGYAGTFYRAHFYASELTAAQVQSDCGSMVAEVAGRGVQTGPVLTIVGGPTIQAIGDSITCGYQNGDANGVCSLTPYASLLSLANQPSYTVNNWGVSGSYLVSMAASEPYRVGEQCRSAKGPVIATVLAGTNDELKYHPSANTLLSYLSAEVKILKNAGCEVYVGTLVSMGGGFDASREAYNALLLTQYKAIGADGVIDFAANPLLGADGAYSNQTYFQASGIHPTQLGQSLMAVAMSNSLNYYRGYTAANPHIASCASSYTLASGDGAVTVSPTNACALTLPDCTGPSGAQYIISNPQSVYSITIVGGPNQPINGSPAAIAISGDSSITLMDVPNAPATSGCHWEM